MSSRNILNIFETTEQNRYLSIGWGLMCGILLHHAPHQSAGQLFVDEYVEDLTGGAAQKSTTSALFNSMRPYIRARGPNYSSLRVSNDHQTAWYSSVLSLRSPFTAQSVQVHGDRFILQFNGELYNQEIGLHDNDTQFIASKLESPDCQPLQVIKSLSGEFAYTIYDKQDRKFYFGRDNVGKRSLSYLFAHSTGDMYISSVSGPISGFTDCVAGVVYIYDTTTRALDDSTRLEPQFCISEEVDDGMDSLDTAVGNLYEVLSTAVEKRVLSIHPMHWEQSPVAVLFSGGLDCSVIAALVCEKLRSFPVCNNTLELLNVGFENPRTGVLPQDTPDRKLAISSTKVLKELYPEIDVRLVKIDVPYTEYLQAKPRVIDLMYPKRTEMDLSIAIAFYFASRGHGKIRHASGEIEEYVRKGIVLFSGLGADELYGGYHKLANKTPSELREELTRQINNIHDRNLNRDDKVIAANGVEVRYPFLDHEVIKFSTEKLPITYKVNKMILRKVASDKLGLMGISDEPKRAIQFGTRSAKMTKNGNKHGTDLLS